MSIELLDELLRSDGPGVDTARTQTRPQLDISRFISIDEWAWRTFNEFFDKNRLGKKGRPIQWEDQTDAHLRHKAKGQHEI